MIHAGHVLHSPPPSPPTCTQHPPVLDNAPPAVPPVNPSPPAPTSRLILAVSPQIGPATHLPREDEAPKMTVDEPPETSSAAPSSETALSPPVLIQPLLTEPVPTEPDAARPAASERSRSRTPGLSSSQGRIPMRPKRSGASDASQTHDKAPSVKRRIPFDEFAAQIRLHRHHEHKLSLLRKRQCALQKCIALASRLHRVGSFIHDGLVEISGVGDKAGFVRTYTHTLDLLETCRSHWSRDIQKLDPLLNTGLQHPGEDGPSSSFVSKLSARSRTDFLTLLHSLRSDPTFLGQRLRTLSAAQIQLLYTSPNPDLVPDTTFPPIPRRRGPQSQQRRNVAFVQSLEDYALRFERSNPLHFLIFNIYGISQEENSPESRLRLDVWSSLCADLFQDPAQRFEILIDKVLSVFATLHEWRAKQKLEQFLMETLQRGAFLLSSDDRPTSSSSSHSGAFDPLRTPEAELFFQHAVRELFVLLNDPDGGFPYGSLHLGSAILGKLGSEDDQSRFRGHLLQWYLCDFLRTAIHFPENENLLLQCHISKGARQYILHQLWSRAQATATEVFSATSSDTFDPKLRFAVDEMGTKLVAIELKQTPEGSIPELTRTAPPSAVRKESAPSFLVLSPSDVIHAIDALWPPPAPRPTSWDPFLSSSASVFAAQFSPSEAEFRPHGLTTTFGGPLRASPNPSVMTARTEGLRYEKGSNNSPHHRYDQLRRELPLVVDIGTPFPSSHPCQETWHVLHIRSGKLSIWEGELLASANFVETAGLSPQELDITQRAALKLIDEHRSLIGSPGSNTGSMAASQKERSLIVLFENEIAHAHSRGDSVGRHFWHNAVKAIQKDYPLSTLIYDDTKALTKMMLSSQAALEDTENTTRLLERQLVELTSVFDQLQLMITDVSTRLEKLRTKMWYAVDVAHSKVYEHAQHVACALNNMSSTTTSKAFSFNVPISNRGRSPSGPAIESILKQSQWDTITMLKAPSDQGGPKKLADDQITMTKKWMQHQSVDNFCKGEERIHRFCMELKLTAKKLVGQNLNGSPVLWSSELYARERALFEGSPVLSTGGNLETRPTSVRSESLSSNYFASRTNPRGTDGVVRMPMIDSSGSPGRKSSFHSLGSSRFSRDLFGIDAPSSTGSPGRAVSATTVDSNSSMWSPHVFPASVTSVSNRSHPGSTYNDVETAKFADHTARERTVFLDGLQRQLTCLLLSDLACAVWSCGSETDAWLDSMLQQEDVRNGTIRRESADRMLSSNVAAAREKASMPTHHGRRKQKRSMSAAPTVNKNYKRSMQSAAELRHSRTGSHLDLPARLQDQFPFHDACRELLTSFRQQADPTQKLRAIHDLKTLVVAENKERLQAQEVSRKKHSGATSSHGRRSTPTSRRSSLNMMTSYTRRHSDQKEEPPEIRELEEESNDLNSGEPSEQEIVRALKGLLLELRPPTLFRDLQYISALVPPDTLSNTESGKAFLHFGLAALAYKDDVCRALVDVAESIISKDMGKSGTAAAPPTLGAADSRGVREAAQYWIVAACEGNAAAQRELASLYLTHPDELPIVSMPFSLSSDTFKSDRMWQKHHETKSNHQAMCLALHWMQHAAKNGDDIAKQRLQELEGNISIR